MRSHIRQLGNSQGLIIPKPLLEEIGVKTGDAVELKVNKKGRLVVAPARASPRTGWAAESKALADAGERDFKW